jgi:hypothetical protein
VAGFTDVIIISGFELKTKIQNLLRKKRNRVFEKFD